MPLKSGNLFVQRVEVSQEQVEPGDAVAVEVEVRNGSVHIPGWDADGCQHDDNPCSSGGIGSSQGYCVEVALSGTGVQEEAQQGCVRQALIGAGKKVFQFTFNAPEATGEQFVSATLTALGTGESETIQQTYRVEAPPSNGGDNGDTQCQSNEDCPDGMVCQGGTCVAAVAGIPRQHLLIAGSVGAVGLGVAIAATSDKR